MNAARSVGNIKRTLPRTSVIEEQLLMQLRASKFPTPEREFKFHPTRKWRFDFAYPEKRLGIECEGGIWTGGRHTTGYGFSADCEKYNAATLEGWRVLRFTAAMVKAGTAVLEIGKALDG